MDSVLIFAAWLIGAFVLLRVMSRLLKIGGADSAWFRGGGGGSI